MEEWRKERLMSTEVFVLSLLLGIAGLALRWVVTVFSFNAQSTPLQGQNHNVAVISHDKYNVGWICALPVELAAVLGMLDNIYERLPQSSNDTNTYILGTIAGHNVVVACLPAESYGASNAAVVATHMRRTFPSIFVWLLVGVGGGAPSKGDIRLGDVFVGTRVVQSDMGKVERGGRLRPTGLIRTPSDTIMTAIAALQAKHKTSPSRIPTFLRLMLKQDPSMKEEFADPGAHLDLLFDSEYEHQPQSKENCDSCDVLQLVQRVVRTTRDPVIHYGTIASANQVMRDARTRDQRVQRLDRICFEMEAAGLMNSCSSMVVVRGISDYSDSHKIKRWQGYAATTAAAYAKELLYTMPLRRGDTEGAHREMQIVEHAVERPSREKSSFGKPAAQSHRFRKVKGGRAAKLVFHSVDAPLDVEDVSAGDDAIEFFGSGGRALLREVLHGPTRGKMFEEVTTGGARGSNAF